MKLQIWIGMTILIFTNHKIYSQDPLAEGIKLLENENYEAASIYFQKVFDKDPKNAQAQYYLGEIQYQLDNPRGAEAAYNKGLDANKCGECQVGLIRLKLDNGIDSKTTRSIESLIKYYGQKNDHVMTLLGDAFLYSKNPVPEKAVEYYLISKGINPKNAVTYSHLGDAYTKIKGKSGEAMSAYEQAIRIEPNNLEANMAMARIWAAYGQLDQAIPKLENAIKLVPDHAPAYKLMYELYLQSKRYQEMIPVLDKYVSLTGNDAKAQMRLIKYLAYQAKDYDRAISEAEKYHQAYPQDPKVYRWFAWSYCEKEKYEEAYLYSKKFFEGVTSSRDSIYLTDWEYLAKSAMKTERLDEASQAYEKVTASDDSRSKDIYHDFLLAYVAKKNYTKVIEYGKKINQIQELDYTDNFYLANAYFQLNQYTESDSVWQKQILLSPTYPQAFYMRAKIADLQDSSRTTWAAKPLYEKFQEVYTSEYNKAAGNMEAMKKIGAYKVKMAEAYNYLAFYYIQQNAIADCKAYLNKALELDPGNLTTKAYVMQIEAAEKANAAKKN